MFSHHRVRLITVLLLLLAVISACAQAEPTPTQSPNTVLSQDAPTPVVVRILNLDLLAIAASPTPDLPEPTPLPTLAPLPAQNPTATGSNSESNRSAPVCTNLAEFVKSLSAPDNVSLKSEQSFAKIWQIKNTGTCTWTTEYSLVYASGEAMGSPASVLLPNGVNPGETVDLRLNLIAPAVPGTYTGNWYLQDESGTVFGLGTDGTQPIPLTIVVKPLPDPPT